MKLILSLLLLAASLSCGVGVITYGYGICPEKWPAVIGFCLMIMFIYVVDERLIK